MDLSIIIVNYKTEELTTNCLSSVYESHLQEVDFEVIVVDNASCDGSIEAVERKFPQVSIIKNKENLGFSKANNIGIHKAKGDYILLLNSDTIVEPNTLKKSLYFIKTRPQVGALGCKVLLENGQLDEACKRSFPTPANGLYHSFKLDKRLDVYKRQIKNRC